MTESEAASFSHPSSRSTYQYSILFARILFNWSNYWTLLPTSCHFFTLPKHNLLAARVHGEDWHTQSIYERYLCTSRDINDSWLLLSVMQLLQQQRWM